jgi:c-di-GMP-binding flagellar brake protein YcgR
MTPTDRKADSHHAEKALLSGVELAEMEVLRALVAQREAVVAHLDGGALMFSSRLCFVDPQRQYIVVELSADAAANAALLALRHVLFVADVDEGRIEFAAADPEPVEQGGAAAIRLRFPEIITTHRRRAFARAGVPPEAPLRCVAAAEGVDYFEASIFDISLGGIGILQAGPNIPLQAGMVLKGCRIECPGRDPIIVELEVRHAGPAALAGGSPAQRAGCRFVNLPPVSAEMVELIEELLSKKS